MTYLKITALAFIEVPDHRNLIAACRAMARSWGRSPSVSRLQSHSSAVYPLTCEHG